MEKLDHILERVFPYAGRIGVTSPPDEEGSFIAEQLVPVRAGESIAQLYRFPANAARTWLTR